VIAVVLSFFNLIPKLCVVAVIDNAPKALSELLAIPQLYTALEFVVPVLRLREVTVEYHPDSGVVLLVQVTGAVELNPLKFCVIGVVFVILTCPITICPTNSIAINKKFKKVFDESNFVSIIF
jgi:hypothetical protein